jgi:hypothetical protein
MRAIRLAITSVILLLVSAALAGLRWTGTHQSPSDARASRLVLSLAVLAGLAGLGAIWRKPSQ